MSKIPWTRPVDGETIISTLIEQVDELQNTVDELLGRIEELEVGDEPWTD